MREFRQDTVKAANKNILYPDHNCWRVDSFRHAAVLIDCANFYRALHDSFSKAKRSIFIVGWEVDSSVRLLRGEDEKKTSRPSVLIDLLAQKAKENPQLNIYVLPWDSSFAFLAERDFMAEYTWVNKTPENIHFCLDQTILGGSHHQKVIVVDDEIAFTGGMDIARQRWDERSHRIHEPERKDSKGFYGPYHDVQILIDGPIVKNFAELVRTRWKLAAGYDALPYRKSPHDALPDTWSMNAAPTFFNMQGAIARTIPQTDDQDGVQEVYHLYLDLIRDAKDFLYIENQFLTSPELAEAINRRLKRENKLKALFISSYDPQGIFESEAMWASRIDFKKIVEEGIEKNRVHFACTGITDENGNIRYKRIHSKILVVDDRYLVVGSSNFTNRSMSFDTECDFTLHAQTQEQREKISNVRNDLLAEHSGRKIHEVEELIKTEYALNEFMTPCEVGRYCLHDIDDTKFTTQNFKSIATKVADPKLNGKAFLNFRNPSKYVLPAAAIFLLASGGIVWFISEHLSWFSPAAIESFLTKARSSQWAFLWVLSVYIIGGFIFFPVTLMSLITAAVFGSFFGPIYGVTGALSSATVMFYLGRWMGLKIPRRVMGDRIRRIDHQFREAGVIGVTVLRVIPLAPFSLVNIAAGISSVRFFDFLLGSFFGFLPAFIVKGLVGDSLTQILLNPSAKTLAMLGIGIFLWLLLVLGSYILAKWWRKRKEA